MNEKPHPTQDTITIKPYRAYKCKSEKRLMTRDKVWKDAFGKFHCSGCGSEAEDVTNTTTGHDFIHLMAI